MVDTGTSYLIGPDDQIDTLVSSIGGIYSYYYESYIIDCDSTSNLPSKLEFFSFNSQHKTKNKLKI